MCELLGMCFAKPITCDVTIGAFARRDVENFDGWGLAWYPDHSISIAKEPLTWRKSRYATFLGTYGHLRSHLYIGHVRAKTRGKASHANTHPFTRELDGCDYCFAHNGTIYEAHRRLPLGRFKPVGTTDSEHMFCHLLDLIERRPSRLEGPEDWSWLHDQLLSINSITTRSKLNCVLSDGGRLFCYHDLNGFKGLAVCEMPLVQKEHEDLDDETMHVGIDSEQDDRGTVVATRPLNDRRGWRPFRQGEMIVIERGEVMFDQAADEVAAEGVSGVRGNGHGG